MVRRGRRFESVRGLPKSACKSALCCWLSVEHADTFRTHPRYARRTATSRGVVRHVCRKRGRGVRLKKLPANMKLPLPAGGGNLPRFPSREGVSEKGHRELASGVEVGWRSATNASSPVNVNGSTGLASVPSRSWLGRVSDA